MDFPSDFYPLPYSVNNTQGQTNVGFVAQGLMRLSSFATRTDMGVPAPSSLLPVFAIFLKEGEAA